MAISNNIKCATHNVPLKGEVVDGQPKGTFSCPVCGIGDTYENIMREIGEYASEKAADMLADTLERSTRGCDFLTFKKGHHPKKVHRFIVDLDLH